MKKVAHKAVAIVGVGAVLPDAPSAPVFWQNIKDGKYSIGDVPTERWNPDLYYDPDPKAPDKSYTKIGGWVREYNWEPLKWRLPIPPKVSEAMDLTQRWAISATREALMDYGYPDRELNPERTAVILGNAMGGDTHLYTASRILFPEFAVELSKASAFTDLPPEVQEKIFQEFRNRISKRFPEITEDTMPGELSNIIAGRIAALYNFRGPNYVADAACASAMAAMSAAVKGLEEYDFDAVITGGIDANMSASTYVKFCKIGALSATGTRPYAKGADGFVMGEGAAVFLIKRLEDAERDGDKIYAVLRAFGGSSDGKGKGITAPNPIGQKLAVKRAWENAGIPLSSVGLIEGHGTSTAVGDAVELQCLDEVFEGTGLPKGSVALGSVKSNIGHLKGAAGAAGMLKAAFALHEKVLPPSLNFKVPNPKIDFNKSAFYVNTELKPWKVNGSDVRRAGVSAFGFGGTNFHAVMEEYIPGRILEEEKKLFAGAEIPGHTSQGISVKAPLRGALVIGAESETALLQKLQNVILKAQNGEAPPPGPPLEKDLSSPVRLAIDYGDATELADKALKAQKALQANQPAMWKMLRAQGIFPGRGPAAKVAFLYTGQGSQYVNMLKKLAEKDPLVARVFEEADRVMTPLLEKPLTEYIFVDGSDESKVKQANKDLMQTAITQPAVLAVDLALTRLLAAYGITPDMVMGHSLGEYGALVAAGVLTFDNALKAVSARGTEMTKVSVEDNGLMAAVFAPLNEIEKIVNRVDGYVEIANINSYSQSVIGGATEAVKKAALAIKEAGYDARMLPVSHAFHTKIVAPASKPLGRVLAQMDLQSPNIPIVANVTGEFYPMGPAVVPEMLDLLSRQVESPVQFIKGLKTLYENGARVFVEVGPKKALHGFVEDVLGQNDDVLALFTNHPKIGDLVSFNQALCGLYAAGLGAAETATEMEQETAVINMSSQTQPAPATTAQTVSGQSLPRETTADSQTEVDKYLELGHLFGEFLERGFQIYSRGKPSPQSRPEKVWITGAAIGLPGTDRVFDDANVERILSGQQFIDLVPPKLRELMVDKNITRVVKSADGSGSFETIHSADEVIKLAARAVNLDIHRDFGFPEDRIAALDTVTALAIGAGIDALRDAGIPLVLHYKTTTKGTQLPEKWQLPDEMRDDTGIIFTSAFPGYDSFAGEMERYFVNRALRQRLNDLQELRKRFTQINPSANGVLDEIDRKIESLNTELEKHPYVFERRFLFKVLSMGHSQFAEYIGARGPNTQINSACASFTTGVGLANDWIQAGRCRRVIIVSADNITSDRLMDWFGAGFLASGAAATDEDVKEAAIPFDRRRHGMIIGMGSAAIVVENTESAKERGLQPIAEVLSTITANSAFHGTRLDVNHISQVMEKLISEAEAKWGINRYEIAPQTVFVSHETYTPARGGSAAAEVNALRHVFGASANRIVIANTKGFTGHPMGVGIEDVVGIKAIETGIVPPVANFKEVDPELGQLNLSTGGDYPVEYALRLGAGFGSQISMMLIRRVPAKDGIRRKPSQLGYTYRIADQKVWQAWLDRVTGYQGAELEVEKRTLRVKDQGPASRVKRPEAAFQKVPAPPGETVLSQPVSETEESAKVAAATVPEVKPTAAADTTANIADVETSVDAVREKVLQLISEQTGYPPDMLEMDLDLEADLGIDTVKQAEMFAAVREAYHIPREDNLQLQDFPTLAHVIQFVYDRRPDLKPAGQSSTAAASQAGTPPGESAPVVETPSVPSPEESGEDPVKGKVLALIAEKTGYPQDMLDLDLDLEADLGIDTVKQAEMFAAVREAYHIPREDNLQLRDFPTLAHVIQFVYDRRPDLKPAGQSSTAAASQAGTPPGESAPVVETPSVPSPEESGEDPVKEKVLALIAEKTGYPQDMLDLDLDLEADLGIDTVKQAEMFAAVREAYNIPREDNLQLRDFPTLAHVIQFVYDRRPDLKPAGQPSPAAASQAETPPGESAPVVETPSAPSPEEVGEDPVKEKVLALIAEKTGYPQDMLDLDLDLEADLGIDTVKQAEMFAAVREAYNIPREDNLQLREFPTLNHVIQFVYDRRPELKVASAGTTEIAPEPETELIVAEKTKKHLPTGDMEETLKIPRRVPAPQLRPPLDFCKPTGVKITKESRVIVMPDQGGVAKALVTKLTKLGAIPLLIKGTPSAEKLTGQIAQWLQEGPIQGVYWLPALDAEGDMAAMDMKTWQQATHTRVKLLYHTMRALYDHIGKAGTFLISATRLGGQHGYDETGALAPLGGAVAGFTKTYKRERSEATVKALDFEQTRKTTALADILIQETLNDPGAVEIGYKNGARWSIGLKEVPAENGQPGMELNKDTVFLVTGAAGSITSAITADLAAASGGTFYLLDLAPVPDPENPDIKRFETDKEGLKRDIFMRLKEKGERATPAMVEKQLSGLEREHAALMAIQAVEKAGGTASYHSVNLLDARAMTGIMKEIKKKSGRIDVLLHAGGLEISHLLPDKNPAEFDLVFDVKSTGWYHILSNLGDTPVSAAVVFSSIAGRFGNAGQTDYSSANDFLCKSVSSFRTTRPQTRGIAIDWTAWGGIGMATRGSIPTIMKQAGIDMLPPEAGIPFIRRELTAGNRSDEVVVGLRLGVMLNEFDDTGGLDVSEGGKLDKAMAKRGIMLETVKGMGLYSGLTVEVTLDPGKQPFLSDHQIGGTPVLPGVMGIEALVEAAKAIFPGLNLAAVEEVEFSAPFKFYRSEPRTVTVRATFSKEGDDIIAHCQLMGSRKLHGQDEAQTTVHFTARVRLSKNPVPKPQPRKQKITVPQKAKKVRSSDIYKLYFHGPAYQVLDKCWRSGKAVVGFFAGKLPPNHHPEELPTLVNPRLIELCFQTAGIWEMGSKGRMGLPSQIRQLRIYSPEPAENGKLFAVVNPAENGSFDAEVIDDNGNVYISLEGYRTSELPNDMDSELLKPLQEAMQKPAGEKVKR